jgi:TonB family protein
MMDPVSLWAARYSLQVLVVVAAAALAATTLKQAPPRGRLSAWRGVLLLCLLLPLVPPRTVDLVLPMATDVSTGLGASGSIDVRAAVPHQWTVALWQLLLLGALVRGAWLAAGFARLGRLRADAGDAVGDDAVEPVWRTVAPTVDIRWHAHVAQPVTFGLRRPIVLLPPRLRSLGPDIRRAVVCHELLHAARRDWSWIVGEEIVRTIFWFHPAVWWLLSRIQLAREETVDARTVAITGSRQRYIEALLTFVGEPARMPAPLLARRPHVVLRIVQLKQEATMSRARLSLAAAIVGVVVVGSTWGVVSAVPLRTATRYRTPTPQVDAASSPVVYPILPNAPAPFARGRSDQQLAPPPPPPPPPPPAPADPALPRVVSERKPDYPTEALPYGIEATTIVKVAIAATGDVVSAQTVKWRLAFEREIDDPNYWASAPEKPFAVASEEAARQWKFAPIPAATTCDISFAFRTRRDGEPVMNTPVASSGVKFLEGGTPGVRSLRVGGAVKPPERVAYVPPQTPKRALDARIHGDVVVEVRVGTNGSVLEARVLRSIPMLDQAALDAVRRWRYTPTLLNGEPVEVVFVTTVNFTGQ